MQKKTIARSTRRSYQIKTVAANHRMPEDTPNFSIADDYDYYGDMSADADHLGRIT